MAAGSRASRVPSAAHGVEMGRSRQSSQYLLAEGGRRPVSGSGGAPHALVAGLRVKSHRSSSEELEGQADGGGRKGTPRDKVDSRRGSKSGVSLISAPTRSGTRPPWLRFRGILCLLWRNGRCHSLM